MDGGVAQGAFGRGRCSLLCTGRESAKCGCEGRGTTTSPPKSWPTQLTGFSRGSRTPSIASSRHRDAAVLAFGARSERLLPQTTAAQCACGDWGVLQSLCSARFK